MAEAKFMWNELMTGDVAGSTSFYSKTAKQCVELGGQVTHGPADIPGVGRIVNMLDPQGVPIAAFTPEAPPPASKKKAKKAGKKKAAAGSKKKAAPAGGKKKKAAAAGGKKKAKAKGKKKKK